MKNSAPGPHAEDPLYPPRAQVYVDETKSKGYFLVAAVVTPEAVGSVRAELRKFVKPGVRRVHFKSERDAVRRDFIALVKSLQVTAVVYECAGRHDHEARTNGLTQLVDELHRHRASKLVLERDDSLVDGDKQVIRRHTHGRRPYGEFEYRHMSPAEEPVLWIADAIAWCVQRGGPWKGLLEELSVRTRRVK
ncbi:hypothetical protein [Arthrobacter sp. RAF14]|uniref:hypothetical protein n=1 Tax=Arthrobacter sp. RAF14 TaxID=3233051 RepID=UPI003F93353B